MTAASDNRKHEGDGSNLGRDEVSRSWNGPIAASAVLYRGTLAGVLLSDTNNPPAIYAFLGDGTMRAIGFVTLGADNTGGALGARGIRVVAETGVLIDKNAGGGSAITIADLYKPIYGADNQTCSKLPADGPFIGILTAIDKATSRPVVLVDPVVNRAWLHASGNTYTQTYSTADRTVANPTATTLTDSSGGTASATLAAITTPSSLTDNGGGSPGTTLAAITVPTALTNSTGGTADNTVAAVGATNGSDVSGTINNNFADLLAKVNANISAIGVLSNTVSSLAAQLNTATAALGVLRNAVASLAAQLNNGIADDLDNRRTLTAIIDDLQAANLVN